MLIERFDEELERDKCKGDRVFDFIKGEIGALLEEEEEVETTEAGESFRNMSDIEDLLIDGALLRPDIKPTEEDF